MSIKLGSTAINGMYLGSTAINQAYLGATEIFSNASTLLDGLLAYYKLDTNGSAPDSLGTYDATISGASYTASGKINGAYSFRGSGFTDSIKLPSINYGTSFTVAFRAKPGTLYNFGEMFGKEFVVTLITYADGHIDYYIGNGSSWGNVITTSASTLTNGTFYSIIATYSGSGTELFVNNTSKGTAVNSPTIGSQAIRVGLRNNGGSGIYPFNGVLDEVGIRNRVLTSDERAERHNSGSGNQYPF